MMLHRPIMVDLIVQKWNLQSIHLIPDYTNTTIVGLLWTYYA